MSIKQKILNAGAYWISYVRLKKILKNIGPSSLVIDCGANTGNISALFLARGARVIAFEPDPLAFKRLEERFRENRNMECINKAVAASDGEAGLFFHRARPAAGKPEFTVSSSLIREKKNVNDRPDIHVETVDLSSYINRLEARVQLLKLDVEGAELGILEKMIGEKTYQKVDLILVETHEKKIPGHDQKVINLQSLLLQKGISNIKLNWI